MLSNYYITPDWKIANNIWRTLTSNAEILTKNNPNFRIDFRGLTPPPDRNPFGPDSGRYNDYFERDLAGFDGGQLQGINELSQIMDSDEQTMLYNIIVNHGSALQGSEGPPLIYWAFTINTELNEGEVYYMYTNKSNTEVAIFPASTPVITLHDSLQYMYPVSTGHPYFVGQGASQGAFITSFDAMVEQAQRMNQIRP